MRSCIKSVVCFAGLFSMVSCRPAVAWGSRSGDRVTSPTTTTSSGRRVVVANNDPRPSDPAKAPSLKEALAAEGRGDPVAALAQYDRLLSGVMPAHERAYVDSRARALAARLPAAKISTGMAKLPARSRVRALLLLRRAELLIAAGKEKQARKVLVGAKALTAGERRAAQAAAGDTSRIGALVPLSGPLRALGRSLLSGMLLAADLTGRSRGVSATIVARDSARDPAGAADDLARAGVVAVVGVPRSSNARKAAPRCQKHGLALLTGADGKGVPQLGRAILRVVHSPVQRARALARHLAATGKVVRVAVAHPNNGYGKRVGAAFAAAATKANLVVVATVAYKRSDTTLYKRFQPLAAKGVQAVFVADSASRLEIIAPQLALAGLVPAPVGQLGKKGRVLLLSTAEGLRARLVKNVAHAVKGAVLAPGFYPDLNDLRLGSFVKAYQRVFGRVPGRYAALGYLAVQRIRSLLVRLAAGRVSMLGALLGQKTAKKKKLFDKDGERTDPPRLYRVHPSGIKRITVATP